MRALYITFSFVIATALPAAAADHAQIVADLDALDRLECFPGNSFIDPRNAFTLLAIFPDAHAFQAARDDGRFFKLTKFLSGRFVQPDVRGREPNEDDPVGGPRPRRPNVLVVSRRPRGRARGRGMFGPADVVQRKFLDEVARLRLIYPEARLSCVYDVERYAKARACVLDLEG